MLRVFFLSCVIVNVGCMGDFVPIPERLSDERQVKLTQSWDQMVSRGEEVDWTTLADVVMLHRLWHVGVDELEFRSVKYVPSGQVVMETHFNRSKPDEDVFTVSYVDARGQTYRSTSYSADEMRKLASIYFVNDNDKVPEETDEAHAERMARVAEMNARRARVQEVFSTPEEEAEQSQDEIPASPAQDQTGN